MSFVKTAKIPLVALAEGSYDADNGSVSFKRVASKKQASIYGDNGATVKIGDMLKMVASEYQISDNPADYIFEAARAVTAEVPNENGDAFPRGELLRFDHRLGKAVYQTFILKPHHINHRADNPKTARGVVLDASYNDLSEPLPECPGCGHKTASVDGRDSSGVNCARCGHVVKDEFVELLLAIDTKKDPTFAHGVKKGSLNSLSMGCEAGYTDCSICGNRARNVAQFCQHIKSGNKKKIFKTASGPKMSYEKCGEVIYTEISRVDQPADPTAKQYEVFSVNMKQPDQNIFSLAARVAKLESKLACGAHLAQADSGELDDVLPQIDEIKETHPELYMQLQKLLAPGEMVPDEISIDDYAKKRDQELDHKVTPAEMGIKPEVGGLPATIATKVVAAINQDLDDLLRSIKKVSEDKTVTTLKFAKSYKDVEALVTDKGNVKIFTPKGTLFVIRPEDRPTTPEASQKIAMEILTSIAENGLVATASKYNAVMGTKVAQVLQFHMEDFAGGRNDGDKGPITDDAMGDIPREKPKKNLQEGVELDHAESLAKPQKDILKNVEYDHAESPSGKPDHMAETNEMSVADRERNKTPKTTLDSAAVDYADKQPKTAQTQAMPPPPPSEQPTMPVTAAECEKCKGACTCDSKVAEMEPEAPGFDPNARMAAKQYISRAERIYKGKLAKVRADADTRIAVAEKTAAEKVQARLLRALKLAAKRQALNLEESPLKARMFDVLASEMDLDADSFYPGMDASTATHIIEATIADGFDEFVNALVKRAAEFLSMNDEAFNSIESDISKLKPAPVTVVASSKNVTANEGARKAALDGNLIVAPSASETVSSGDARSNIRSALGTTKVSRTSQALLK